MKKLLIIGLSLITISALTYFAITFTSTDQVNYNTEVKPILNKRCISCHGGVKREADFSLLFRQEALAKTESGVPAIIPGDAAHSEMIKRILSHDPEERMPYKKDPLTKKEIEILTKWIDQGAVWGDHWAYTTVKEQELPPASDWTSNEIDRIILAKMEEHNVEPSTKATKETLLRRTALDVIGMPASDDLSEKFLKDQLSYEGLVDSLLNSPHFGERWAAVWMDLARYADTKGYERDAPRTIWRYRDWLIKAFNRDMPYDSFLIEQLAGDLLPSPTDEQYIATAFHRNTMTNDEGGTENEEYRTAAVLDRVNTTWEALMGTTFACVQCHSHPYDPFRHDEYYKFMAFFNDARDEDTYDDYPLLRKFEKEDEQKLASIKTWVAKNVSEKKAQEVYTFVKTWQPTINSIQADQFTNSELTDTKWLIFRNQALCRMPRVDLTDKKFMIVRYSAFQPNGVWTIHIDRPDGPVLKTIRVDVTNNKWKLEEIAIAAPTGVHDLYFTYTNKNLKTPEANGMIFDWFYFTDYSIDQSGNKEVSKDYWSLLYKETPTVPVMMDNPSGQHRTTQVFERGNWLVKGDTVQPDVPALFPPFPQGAPRNRLGLARWITSVDNPLTARTIVNRVWEQIYGIGLVETLEDMGTQGMTPTHPELLDHLSWKLINENHWSLKKLIREIVLSSTYQQDSKVLPEHLKKDPNNMYYTRAPRVRLSAEQVRDQALSVSGLLSTKMYGPSVMPYQPGGIWLSPWSGGESWKRSQGEDQHRRGVYTYWKRTAPYPSMMTFDGTAREVCSARRIRTNTPLQALVTLNDSVYVEASYSLAVLMKKNGNNLGDQIKYGYKRAIGHEASPEVIQALMNLHERTSAKATIKTVKRKEEKEENQDKAMMLVANTILNLDEFVTKN